MRKFVWLLSVFALLTPRLHAQEKTDAERVAQILNSMTLEEKVGQMFMVNIYGKEMSERAAHFIQQYHPGAVAIFGYNTDYEPLSATTNFINQIQAESTSSGAEIPMFIAIDQEGGKVQRLSNGVTYFPDPLGLGATTEAESVERIGFAVGSELKAIGINMNLAPVADLHTREDMVNPYSVMHRRTFGDNPQRVGEQTAAYVRGMEQVGVIGVVKHFPGHGGTGDSHAELPVIDMDAETALTGPLYAFEVAIQKSVPAIMVGHLYYQSLEPVENLPASLSPILIGILREDFGFDGVIMTDAMDMDAITENFEVPLAALMFVQAGGDMIVAGPYLSWEMQIAMIQRLIEAVRSGELTESRIDESVRRILLLKAHYGLLDWQPVDTENIYIDLEASQKVLIETYMDAATLVKDTGKLLPLSQDDNLTIIYPIIYQEVLNTCITFAPDADFYGYSSDPQDLDYSAVNVLGRNHEKIVIFVEDAFFNPRISDLVLRLPPEKTIVVALGTPYDLETMENVSTFLAMYNSIPASRTAACHVLFGKHSITGRLPIAAGQYPSGRGIGISADTHN